MIEDKAHTDHGPDHARPSASTGSKGRDMAREAAQDTRRRFESLKRARQPFDSIWEEVAEHMGPAYAGFATEPGHPRRRREDLVDSTARRAANIFAAGMLAGASSPAQRWFTLGVDDRERMDRPEARAWLQDVEDYRSWKRCGPDSTSRWLWRTLRRNEAKSFVWRILTARLTHSSEMPCPRFFTTIKAIRSAERCAGPRPLAAAGAARCVGLGGLDQNYKRRNCCGFPLEAPCVRG